MATNAAAASTSRADIVADGIREAIVRHELRPGQRLHQQELCARFGVSQTPMREALARLAGEGWVEYHPQRGARVASVTAEELADIYQLRLRLEPWALERSLDATSDAWLAEVERTYERLQATSCTFGGVAGADYEEFERRHVAFHTTLLSNCGSGWLVRFTTTLIEQGGRFRRLSVPLRERRAGSVHDEHARIRAAVTAGERDQAVQLLHDHLALTQTSVLQWIEEQRAEQGGDIPPPA